ncbi:MAG: endonuclease/exonuclease/phosphatase family protein [Myxococcota bacterium]
MELPRALDVLTLNVWGLPWPFARDRTRRFERIARHFDRRSYDVIGVQEAWWPFGSGVAIPGLKLGTGGDSGLGLAGTLVRGAETELLRFDRASGADRLASKGLLRTEVGGLTIAVTHLQANDDAVDLRLDQVRQIVGWLGGVTGPILVLGDFNFVAADAGSEAALAEAGFRDAAAADPRPTWSPRNPFATGRRRERFDRIYLRDGAAARWTVDRVQVLPRLWSDHWPLAAHLALG